MTEKEKEAYKQWKKMMLRQLPKTMPCEDCNGTGLGECPHCGNEGDCDICGGDGTIPTTALLNVEFYLRVHSFEQAMYEHWKKGDALHVEKGKPLPANPLKSLLSELEDMEFDSFSVGYSKIILAILN